MTRSLLRALALFTALLSLADGARQLSLFMYSSDEATAVVPKEQRDFDYFMFVSYHFTIHGLWPNYDDGTWPQFCDASYKFDEDKLEDLMDELESEWPTVYDSYETFWEHEWSKHGTCALRVFPSEHSFFKHVLKLHQQYNLAAALRAADILPSKDAVYRTKDIVNAIDDMYGVQPLVHCAGKQLSEIWMCFDKDLVPFDCDTSHERNNCQEVTIPPFKRAHRDAELGGKQAGKQQKQGQQQHLKQHPHLVAAAVADTDAI